MQRRARPARSARRVRISLLVPFEDCAMRSRWLVVVTVSLLCGRGTPAQDLSPVPVAGHPLAANGKRLMEALDALGAPLPDDARKPLKAACDERDAARIQKLLDPHALLAVHINPEVRVRVARGPAKATLQQAGYTPVLVKVTNDSTATKPLRISSPQAGPPRYGPPRGAKFGPLPPHNL